MKIGCIVGCMWRGAQVLLICCLAGVHPGEAAADLGSSFKFDIPPQPLPTALLKYSEQSGVQVTSSGQLIAGHAAAGVVGTFDAKDALRRLLQGTDLGYTVIGRNTVVITSDTRSAGAGRQDSSSPEQNSQQGAQSPSLWERFRTAQAGDQSPAGSSPVTAAPVFGQQRPDAPVPVVLEEVIVTATRRAESAQNVPASLTVLGGTQLDNLGITNINDMAALVPGLQVASGAPGANEEVLRGISTGLATTGATVATYFDDVPTTGTSYASAGEIFTPDPDLFDVQRVEVLKGPQGTLFGASSMGGLIHYVFNEPNLEKFEGKAEVGFQGIPAHGTGNAQRLLVNLPLLKDTLAIRMDGFRLTTPGYIDNVFRHQTDTNTSLSEGGRVSILWKPFDDFSARATSYYQRLTADVATVDVQPQTLQPTSGELQTAVKLPQSMYSKWFVNNLTLSYDFPWANLLSSTSLQKQFTDLEEDASNLYGTLYGPLVGGNAARLPEIVDLSKTTEEVRLTSPTGQKLEWLGGFYYTHEIASTRQSVSLYDATGATDILLAPDLITAEIQSRLRETAGFGDVTYHFNPAFDLQAGIRYGSIVNQYNQPYETLSGTPLVPPLAASTTLDKTTYLGVARYHFDRDTMLYARVATGYRPGGPNDRIPGSTAPATYAPDNLVSYELGLKGDLADNVFNYTVDVYRINWKNIQVIGVDPATSFTFYANGGKAYSQGLELEFGYRPLANLRLGLTGALNQAKLDADLAIPGAVGSSGDELPYAPKVAVTGTVDYMHPLSAALNGFAGLTVAEVGARRAYFASQVVGIPALGPEFASTTGILPSYTTLDLRCGVIHGPIRLTVYARNVTDERGALALNATTAGADATTGTVGPAGLTVIQPRTFGATLRYEF
jgi:iron complex outermembrane receptor protein